MPADTPMVLVPRIKPEAVARLRAFAEVHLQSGDAEDREEAAALSIICARLSAPLPPAGPADFGVIDCATWVPLDDNGLAEVRVNGKRITSMPSYAGAEEVAERINAALQITRDFREALSTPTGEAGADEAFPIIDAALTGSREHD